MDSHIIPDCYRLHFTTPNLRVEGLTAPDTKFGASAGIWYGDNNE